MKIPCEIPPRVCPNLRVEPNGGGEGKHTPFGTSTMTPHHRCSRQLHTTISHSRPALWRPPSFFRSPRAWRGGSRPPSPTFSPATCGAARIGGRGGEGWKVSRVPLAPTRPSWCSAPEQRQVRAPLREGASPALVAWAQAPAAAALARGGTRNRHSLPPWTAGRRQGSRPHGGTRPAGEPPPGVTAADAGGAARLRRRELGQKPNK